MFLAAPLSKSRVFGGQPYLVVVILFILLLNNLSHCNSGHTNIITFTLFLKSLDHKHPPHAQRISHDFLSLLRSLLSSRSLLSLRACFSCHTFFPGTIEKKISEKEKVDFVFSAVWEALFRFFSPAG